MRADLDLLCISVYCTVDELLPSRPGNGRRKLTDADVVTVCVAQVLMGIPSDAGSSAPPSASSDTCSRCCQARTRSTSAERDWPRRSSG